MSKATQLVRKQQNWDLDPALWEKKGGQLSLATFSISSQNADWIPTVLKRQPSPHFSRRMVSLAAYSGHQGSRRTKSPVAKFCIYCLPTFLLPLTFVVQVMVSSIPSWSSLSLWLEKIHLMQENNLLPLNLKSHRRWQMSWHLPSTSIWFVLDYL